MQRAGTTEMAKQILQLPPQHQHLSKVCTIAEHVTRMQPAVCKSIIPLPCAEKPLKGCGLRTRACVQQTCQRRPRLTEHPTAESASGNLNFGGLAYWSLPGLVAEAVLESGQHEPCPGAPELACLLVC